MAMTSAERKQKYTLKHKELGLCVHCSKKAVYGRWCKKHYKEFTAYQANKSSTLEGKAYYTASSKRSYLKKLIEVVSGYGGGCKECGETDIAVLDIDHVNSDGAKQRKLSNHPKSGYSLLLWLVKNNYPKSFQILCANCHARKHRKWRYK